MASGPSIEAREMTNRRIVDGHPHRSVSTAFEITSLEKRLHAGLPISTLPDRFLPRRSQEIATGGVTHPASKDAGGVLDEVVAAPRSAYLRAQGVPESYLGDVLD